jgi:glycerol-3-phosphate acyltransferase PlsX
MRAARSPRRGRRITSTTTETSSSGAQPGSSPSATPDDPKRETVVTVAVDCNGSDLGPAEVAAGAAIAAAQGIRMILFGPADELGETPRGVEIIDAPVSIAKSSDPVSAVRNTPEASIVQAARAVAAGRAQALVCAGGTGAALAAGTFNIRRAPGIYRPALALPVPVPRHPVTLVDVGANAECRREHLVQFAFMGAALANAVLGVKRPRVGLLSNGEEPERGSQLLRETHAELLERTAGSQPFEFVGNVEGGDVVDGVADVIVTDGLTGNIALKLIEGVSQVMLRAIRDAATSSARGKLGGLLLRSSLGGFREEIDPEAQGGAYLLGLRRLGVVPHGSFSRAGFASAIMRAELGAREDVIGRTQLALEQAGALREPPVSAQAASLPHTG